MQLLRTILIIIIVYYLFRLFARYVMPWIARYFIQRSMKGFEQQRQKQSRKNGEINIDYSPGKKGSLDNLGEYVDYEEIDEDKRNNYEKHSD